MRQVLLAGAVLFVLVVTIATETLSLISAVSFWPLATLWTILGLVVACCLVAKRSALATALSSGIRNLSFGDAALLTGTLFILFVIFLTAVVVPPNTFDSMTYHMARVVHWIENGTLRHYPTHIDRQLWMQPLPEILILHLQILSGSDRFANMIQYLSLIGSLIGISLIVRELGGDRKAEIAGIVVGATVPMAILQGSSTQTDLVVSFFCLCLASSLLLMRNEQRIWHVLFFAVSLGLALLSKGTAYIYAFPFLLWFACLQFRQLKTDRTSAVGAFALVGIIVLFINAGHFARNYELYGKPFGNSAAYRLTNEVHDVRSFVSNVVRNEALHLIAPEPAVNRIVDKGVELLHEAIGLSPNDRRTTFAKSEFDLTWRIHEDYSGNLLHALLFVIAITWYIVFRKITIRDPAYPYIGSIVVSFFLFCFYLKWQPYNSRLHLPLFMLAAPIMGVMIVRLGRGGSTAVLACLLVASTPFLIHNQIKPLLPVKESVLGRNRETVMFANRPAWEEPQRKAARYVMENGCRRVGLVMGMNDFEYPLWVLLRNETGRRFDIQHVNVHNVSSRMAQRKFVPDCIFSTVDGPSLVTVGNVSYEKRCSEDAVSVYSKAAGESHE